MKITNVLSDYRTFTGYSDQLLILIFFFKENSYI